MKTLISKRTKQIEENYNDIAKLQDIYCKIGYDFGIISDELISSLRENRNKKREIKGELGETSMAVFNREYELSDEYLILKSCKYQLEGLKKLMSGLSVRIESLKAEAKGQY
jgi:hypothetical protein